MSDPPPPRRRSALVIDGDVTVCLWFEEHLRARGYFVELARNGDDALLRLRERGVLPDVIFVDIRMPGCDGVCFADQLRRHKDYEMIPLIVMSADVWRHRMAWIVGIQKPTNEADLDLVLERYVG